MLESVNSHTSSAIETRGTYVFAVTAADGTVETIGQQVEAVDHGDLTALTAPIDLAEAGATERMKRRHEKTLEALGAGADHVPLPPGMTFGGPQAVRGFLADHRGLLCAELERLGDARQCTMRLSWDHDDPAAHLADKYPELGELRRAADEASGPRIATLARRLSRRLDQAVAAARRDYREVLERRVVRVCRELEYFEPDGDEELVRLRCLLPHDARERFETRLYELADDLGEATVVELTELQPPRAFLDERLVF